MLRLPSVNVVYGKKSAYLERPLANFVQEVEYRFDVHISGQIAAPKSVVRKAALIVFVVLLGLLCETVKPEYFPCFIGVTVAFFILRAFFKKSKFS